MEKENNSSVGLFSSFTNQRLDLLGQDKARAGGKKKSSQQPAARPAAQKQPKNKKVVVSPGEKIGIKISDRLFSETTLNYVASGLGDISLNEDSEDNAVFASPSPAECRQRQEEAEVETDKTEPELLTKFSPAIGQAPQATSTPNLVKVRLSAAQSLQSPLLLNNSGMVTSTIATELIHRKGGKRWRRSSRLYSAGTAVLNLAPELNGGGGGGLGGASAAAAAAASATPTCSRRRATIMVWHYA